MASKIEQMIDEIEEYIDSCKTQMFNSSTILVNKEEIEELLNEMREKTPREIERYQKIISNKEAILADAQTKAEAMLANAKIKKENLVSEHQVMQQAYAEADKIVMDAQDDAQKIVNDATIDANNIRLGAMQYTDDILKNLETAISSAMTAAKTYHDSYMSALEGFLEIVVTNRAELNPMGDDFSEEMSSAGEPNIEITSNTGKKNS